MKRVLQSEIRIVLVPRSPHPHRGRLEEQLVQVEQEKILQLYFQDLLLQELVVEVVVDTIIHLLQLEKVD